MERLIFVVSKFEKKQIRQAAAREDMNMSAYIRYLHQKHISEYPLPPAIDQKVVEGGEK